VGGAVGVSVGASLASGELGAFVGTGVTVANTNGLELALGLAAGDAVKAGASATEPTRSSSAWV
jgi:hypothetical protein